MRGLLLAGLVCMLLAAGPGEAWADVLTFDDLADPGSGLPVVPDGYGGLDWDTFNYMNATTYSGGNSGYNNSLVSGTQLAFNASAASATVSDSTFDFTGAYLGAAWRDGLSIRVTGYSTGSLIYDTTVVVDSDDSTWFAFNYLGIDELRFTSSGGVENPSFSGSGAHFAMDDFTYDLDAVPEPTTLALFGLGAAGLALRRRRKNRTAV